MDIIPYVGNGIIIIDKNIMLTAIKIKVNAFFIVNPLIFVSKEEIKGDKKIVKIQEPPVTIPISVFDIPKCCKNTAIKPFVQHNANQ